jgi:hydrogenase expression/formation protein HypC
LIFYFLEYAIIIKTWRRTFMCLGIPSKIISIENSNAVVDVYGAQRNISLLVLADEVKIGDYVLVHAGFAIQKLQEDVAQETLGYFNEYLASLDGKDLPRQSAKKTGIARKRRFNL